MDYTVYTDGFPWLKWSRHFTGETSVRVKLIESYNLLSTVLTVALWSGNDDYETTKKCGHAIYKQLKELKTIQHPLTGQEIKIIRCMCGDGRKNLNGKPLSEYYPGTAHLGFRSAGTLCLPIAKIAAGTMCLFKLVNTDSDCVVQGGGGGGGV